MPRQTVVVTLALCLTLVGCGVESSFVDQATQNLEIRPSVSGAVTESQSTEPSSRALGGPWDEASDRPQCCHGQCRNTGGPWVGPWKWSRGSVRDGHCASTVKGFCGGRGYDVYYAYWDPC